MAKEIKPVDADLDDVARAMTRSADPPEKPVEATHHGILSIGGLQLEVYVLEDGRRVFAKRVMARALGLKSGGGNAFLKTLSGKKVGSEIDPDLRETLEILSFSTSLARIQDTGLRPRFWSMSASQLSVRTTPETCWIHKR